MELRGSGQLGEFSWLWRRVAAGLDAGEMGWIPGFLGFLA